MKISNHDNEIMSTEKHFKRLHDFMPDQLFRMLICGAQEQEKTNTMIHMLLKYLRSWYLSRNPNS